MYYELALHQIFSEDETITTSIEELATLWQCSTRYAKTVINRLHDEQVLQWQVFRGRGKKPQIKLRRSKLDAVYDIFDHFWQQEQFERAYSLLIDQQLMNHPTIESWLHERYGIQQNKENEHIFRMPFYPVELMLDPLFGISRHDGHFADMLHERLFTYNAEKNTVEPNLVFHYETDDYQTWRLLLRKDVYFHDLTLLTAEVVAHSLKRTIPVTEWFFTYKDISVINDFELILTLETPFMLLPNCLAGYRTSILPIEHKQGTIGCGAFLLVTNTDEKLQLQVFSKYFKQRPWIDGIEIFYTQDVANFGVSTIPFADDVAMRTLITQEQGGDYISLNAQKGPLANAAYRETVYSLIDAASFTLFERGETIAYSWIFGEKLIPTFSERLVDATQFPPLKIGVQQIRAGVNHEREALILQQVLANYGIESTLHICDFKEKVIELEQQYDLFVGGSALGEDMLLSRAYIYTSEPNTILCMAPNLIQQQVKTLYQPVENLSHIENVLQQIDQQLQQSFCLKFLNHRIHTQYVRQDFSYQNIQFDNHGRIAYKVLFA